MQKMKVMINKGYRIANNAFGSLVNSAINDHFPTSSLCHEMGVDGTGI